MTFLHGSYFLFIFTSRPPPLVARTVEYFLPTCETLAQWHTRATRSVWDAYGTSINTRVLVRFSRIHYFFIFILLYLYYFYDIEND